MSHSIGLEDPLSSKTPYTASGLKVRRNGYDVGTPCINDEKLINIWSMHKPIAITPYKDAVVVTDDDLRESDTENGYYYGVKMILKNPCEIHTHGFEYSAPVNGVNCFRLLDWCGYDPAAQPFPKAEATWLSGSGEVNMAQGEAFKTTFNLSFDSATSNGINLFKCIAGDNWANQSFYPILIISSIPEEDDDTPPVFWARAMVECGSDTAALDLTQATERHFYLKNDFEQNYLSNGVGVAEVKPFFFGNNNRRVSIAFLTVAPDNTGLMNNNSPVDFSKWTRLDYISGIENGIGVPFLPLPYAIGVEVTVNGISDSANTPGVYVTSAVATTEGIEITATRNFGYGDSLTQHKITITVTNGGIIEWPEPFIRIFGSEYFESGMNYQTEETYTLKWQEDLGYPNAAIPPGAENLRIVWKTYNKNSDNVYDDEAFAYGSMPVIVQNEPNISTISSSDEEDDPATEPDEPNTPDNSGTEAEDNNETEPILDNSL